jgi:hypothetical protein
MLPSLSLTNKSSSSCSASGRGRGRLPQKTTHPNSHELGGGFGEGDPADISPPRPRRRTTKKEFHRYDFTDENGHSDHDMPAPLTPAVPQNETETANISYRSSGKVGSFDAERICAPVLANPRVGRTRTSTLPFAAEAEEDAKVNEEPDDDRRLEGNSDTTARTFAFVSVRVCGGDVDNENDNSYIDSAHEEKVGDRAHRLASSRSRTDANHHRPLKVSEPPSAECGGDNDDDKCRLDLSYSSSSDEDEEKTNNKVSRNGGKARALAAAPAPSGRTATTRRRSGWDVEVCLGGQRTARSDREDGEDDDRDGGRGRRLRRRRRHRPDAIAYQSCAILQCSAPALVPHLVPISRRENKETKEEEEEDEAEVDDGDSASHLSSRRTRNRSAAASHGKEPDPIYRLCLPNASLDDWRLLEPFLQPPTLAPTEFGVHTATLTPQHLVLLPWFVQLQLHVLWEQADDILSRIAWDSHSDPVQELLVWSHIAHAAHLQRTSVQACHAWQRLLSPASNEGNRAQQRHPQPHGGPPVVRLAYDLEALASLCRLLEAWDVGRRHLWIHLVRYVPHDLDVFHVDDKDVLLLKNPLLPYLIREGIYKHCAEVCITRHPRDAIDATDPKFLCSEPTVPGPPDVASILSNRSTIGRTLLPPHPLARAASTGGRSSAVTSTGKPASGLRHDRHHTSEPRDSVDEVGEWQASFEQWFRWLVPMTQDELDDVAADIVYCPSSLASSVVNDGDDHDIEHEAFGPEGASVASSTPLADILAKIPADRLQWLEEIWRRLQEPPILPPVPTSDAQDSPARAAPISGRQRSVARSDLPPRRTGRRRGSRPAADCSTPPRSFRNATTQYPGSPGTTEHSTRRSEQSLASASATSIARLRRYASPDRSASPLQKSVATPGSWSATSSYCSKNDESNSSTLSTHPLNTSADGSEETSYSSIGVVRAKTRTFYC